MTDPVKLHADATRAARAKAIIDDELFKEAFLLCENTYMKAWAESEPHETRKREALYTAVQLLADVRGHLGIIMSHGSLARAELKVLEDKLKTHKVA